MKTILLIFVFAITLQLQCKAQTFDPTWAARFQTVLDNIVKANHIKGASAAVWTPEQGTWTGVSGISSDNVPITPNMRFGIESNTKLFTTVMILQLQEKGQLSLNDSLDKWLPSFPNIDSTITIRQLLAHQSGINGYYWNTWFTQALNDTTRLWTPEEVLASVKTPLFLPAHGFRYSNANYVLAGMIIEAVTGKTWLENLHALILDPLQLNETFAAAFEEPNGTVAHEWNASLEYKNSPLKSVYSMLYAGGAIFSTARDMVKWYSELFSEKVISAASIKQILSFEPTVLLGLGVTANYDRHLYYGGTGSSVGYKSTVFYDSQNKSSICMLTNSGEVNLNEFGNLTIRPLLEVQTNNYPKQTDDAGIVSVINPKYHAFYDTIKPVISLHNYGTSILTSADIYYRLGNGDPYLFKWTGSLKADSTTILTLPPMDLTEGLHQLIIYTSRPNGQSDGFIYNDTIRTRFIRHPLPSYTTPFTEDFEGPVFPPEEWITSSGSLLSWQRTAMVAFHGTHAAIRNNYVDNDHIGASYDLDMPILDLSGTINPRLSFHYASAYIPDYRDSLAILVSTDHGKYWDTLFFEGGATLGTAPFNSDPFYPQTSQWKECKISLAAYAKPDVLIRFSSINGWGNNLYIDLVKVEEQPVGIDQLSSPEPMQVYPNPATDRITISGLPLNSEIKITDVYGRIIRIVKTDGENMNISLSGFTKGIYLLKSKRGMKKFIVQ